jgi:hypothetical protein
VVLDRRDEPDRLDPLRAEPEPDRPDPVLPEPLPVDGRLNDPVPVRVVVGRSVGWRDSRPAGMTGPAAGARPQVSQ